MAGSSSGHRVLIDLIGEVMGALDLDELHRTLMSAVPRAVPADWVSLTELGPDRVVVLIEPDVSEEQLAKFAQYADENPLYQLWVRTKDGRAYRFSDVTTRDELEATRVWQEFYGPLGVNHQIAFTLPNEPDHVLAFVLSRRNRDFTDEERDLLNEARPFLVQAYRNALEHAARGAAANADLAAALHDAGLTAREAQVMELVARGGSNRDAAEHLGVSGRTVEKHLERAFRKLGATSRSAAAARAWELARTHAPKPREGPPAKRWSRA
ncbi:MAG TPA: helix-turn-helix transcriptional regulator [Solirubrobacteraceae bacterium]|jgi:DNA-binding CsgD family transcriptional regulator